MSHHVTCPEVVHYILLSAYGINSRLGRPDAKTHAAKAANRSDRAGLEAKSRKEGGTVLTSNRSVGFGAHAITSASKSQPDVVTPHGALTAGWAHKIR